jgi:hypothetical protein
MPSPMANRWTSFSDDNSTAEWGDVDLCQYTTISLFWDAKKQTTRAVGE